jgi:small-conductance mechanosensitive channel
MIAEKMINSITMVWNLIIPPMLTLLLGVVLVLVGWLIAKLLQWVVSIVLKALMLDKGASSIGLTPILAKGEIKRPLSDLLSDLVYWLTVVISVVAAADFLGLRIVKDMIDRIIAYMPSVLSASVVLGAAMFLAPVIASLVLLILANVGVANAKIISRVIYYALVLFALVMSFALLGLDMKAILSRGDLILGTVGLAIAIAAGLGCKDIAGDFITNLFKTK